MAGKPIEAIALAAAVCLRNVRRDPMVSAVFIVNFTSMQMPHDAVEHLCVHTCLSVAATGAFQHVDAKKTAVDMMNLFSDKLRRNPYPNLRSVGEEAPHFRPSAD